jgi:superfamily II DNA or RNA helicase
MLLRDYQTESVAFLVARKRAMIVAPAGSGKTVIGAAALAQVLRPGMKVTIIVNTREQLDQMAVAVSRVEGPQDVDLNICCAAAMPDTADSDIVVFDECHHVPAETWLRTAGKAGGRVFGLTATPWHEDEERNKVVRDVFKEFYVIDRARVLASGHLVEGKVWMHDLDRPGEFDQEIDAETAKEVARRVRAFPRIARFEHERRAKWQITQEKVQANLRRNQHVIDMAVQEKDMGASVLVLVYSIEHGEELARQIPGAFVVHSKLPKKKRTQAIEDFRAGVLQVLVATSLADEGLDVPRASCLILAAGGRSAGKLEQRAGRVLRPHEGKVAGTIHDYLDRGATFAHAQARARMRVYEKLGYAPEIVFPSP